jgi:hypothetical protein
MASSARRCGWLLSSRNGGIFSAKIVRLARHKQSDDEAEETENRTEDFDHQNLDKPKRRKTVSSLFLVGRW